MIYFEHRGSSILRNVGTLAPDNIPSNYSFAFAPGIARLFSVPY